MGMTSNCMVLPSPVEIHGDLGVTAGVLDIAFLGEPAIELHHGLGAVGSGDVHAVIQGL
jgi:hypothetical protein